MASYSFVSKKSGKPCRGCQISIEIGERLKYHGPYLYHLECLPENSGRGVKLPRLPISGEADRNHWKEVTKPIF